MQNKAKVWFPVAIFAVLAGAMWNGGFRPGCTGGACLPLPFALGGPPSEVAAVEPPETGSPEDGLPVFSGKTLDGALLNRAELLGSPSVVHFWATWCQPCIEELPEFRELHRDYADDGVRFLAVSLDNPADPAVREMWVERFSMPFPTIFGNDSLLDDFGGLGMLPLTVVFDDEGNRLKAFHGQVDPARIGQVLDTIPGHAGDEILVAEMD